MLMGSPPAAGRPAWLSEGILRATPGVRTPTIGLVKSSLADRIPKKGLAMALETKPVWALDLKKTLSRPYTADEMARLQDWGERIKRINDDRVWPPGTFQRLLDLAHAEDAARGE